MKIDTLNHGTIETNQLNDADSDIGNFISTCGIKEIAEKYNTYCFAVIGTPQKNKTGWSIIHSKNPDDTLKIIDALSKILYDLSDKKLKLAIVPSGEEGWNPE